MNELITKGTAAETVRTEQTQPKSKAEIWQEVIDTLVDPASGMDEEEQANYAQKIIQKLKSGRRLTSEELEYLRLHNPELYQTAVRVENSRKALKEKLKSCHSKEEVQQVVSVQMEVLRAMEQDPDIEYMTAMVKKEIEDFKQSSRYARLPQKREDAKGKVQNGEADTKEDSEEEDVYSRAAIYGRMQIQCDMITRMTQAFS